MVTRRRSGGTRKCMTPQCEETLSNASPMRYCVNCRSGMYRWSLRPPSHREEYQRKLSVRTARLDNIGHRKDRTK